MWQDLDFLEFVKLLLCFLGGVYLRVVLLKQGACATNGDGILLLQLVVNTVQLLAEEFDVHSTAIRNQFKVKHALKVPPDGNHHLLAQTALTRN